jgi:hypothetical protein
MWTAGNGIGLGGAMFTAGPTDDDESEERQTVADDAAGYAASKSSTHQTAIWTPEVTQSKYRIIYHYSYPRY